MIIIRKIYLGLALCLGALAPVAAAPAIRVAVRPNIVKATAQFFLARPNLIMAGLGAASLAYAKHCAQKAEDPAANGDMKKYERRGNLAVRVGAGLLGLSANCFIQSQLKKRGYLPALSNITAGLSAGLLALGFNVIDHGVFLQHHEDNNSALTEAEKERQPYAEHLILAGLQACIAAGTYLYMA